jgi:tripartite-type tricarboxylate transporter receptor subunit TctC
MINKHVLMSALALAAVGLAGAPDAAHAQAAYPNRPVKLIVPYAAGGGTDAIARLVAQAVSERLGQTMVVENMPAAGGNVATQTAASAPADGYTVLMANQGPMVVNPHLFKTMKVDPLTVFEPVTLITSAPLALVVPAKSPKRTVGDFFEFARKNPGKLSYGSAGNGSASHLATVLLAQVSKIDFVHVPYRGAGPALNDLVSGQTDFMVTTMPSVAGLIEAGTVRALAVTTSERTRMLPNTPTLAEAGAKDYETGAWYGFVVPKGTPGAIIERLRAATIEAINSDLVKSRFANEGAAPIGSTPEEFRQMMQAESKRWAEVVKSANLSIH